MRSTRPWVLVLVLALSGCAIPPFGDRTEDHRAPQPSSTRPGGAGPVLTTPTEALPAPSETGPDIEAPPPAQLPRERPKAPPATLSPASRALVTQAQAQRRKGDLPGASVSLDRALRIEPNNPLLWIELGRLRMDQRNFPQAENMGRKALAMSVGDDRTQASAWQLIADSLRARGRNTEAQDAADRARALTAQ